METAKCLDFAIATIRSVKITRTEHQTLLRFVEGIEMASSQSIENQDEIRKLIDNPRRLCAIRFCLVCRKSRQKHDPQNRIRNDP